MADGDRKYRFQVSVVMFVEKSSATKELEVMLAVTTDDEGRMMLSGEAWRRCIPVSPELVSGAIHGAKMGWDAIARATNGKQSGVSQ